MKINIKKILYFSIIIIFSCSTKKDNNKFLKDLNPALNKTKYQISSIYEENEKIVFKVNLNKKYNKKFKKEQDIISMLLARKYLRFINTSKRNFGFYFYNSKGVQFYYYGFYYDLSKDINAGNPIQEFIFQYLVFSSLESFSSDELFQIELLFERILNIHEKDFILNCDFTGLLHTVSELFLPIIEDEKFFILSQHHIFMSYITNPPFNYDVKRFNFLNKITNYVLKKYPPVQAGL